MILASATLALALLTPQGGDELLVVERDPQGVRISANRAGVPCDDALAELATRMGWNLHFQPEALRTQLADQVVDLAFRDEGPRTLATLLATAGGADAVFHERLLDGTNTVDVTIVTVPDPTTAAGRARLRRQALDWYRVWLSERMARGQTGDEDEVRVRGHLAELLRDDGDLEAAARTYATIAADEGQDLAPAAQLRLATVEFELGPEHWVEAERRARELIRLYPERAEASRGLLLLGRVLLARGRARECVTIIERAYVRLTGTPDLVPAYLLMARARLDCGEPDAARAALRQLAAVRTPSTLPPTWRREELLLRGLSEAGRGAADAAIEAFQELLTDSEVDSLVRGQAWVGLGEACLRGGRTVHAAAASAAAERCRDTLDPRWRLRATALSARVAFALGEDERGLLLLEDAARDGSAPELTAFLAEELARCGRQQRADEVAATIASRDDLVGDRARIVRIEVGLARARDADSPAEAIAEAARQAAAVRDPGLRRIAREAIAAAAFDATALPEMEAETSSARALLLSGLRGMREARALEASGNASEARQRRDEALAEIERARGALAPLAADREATSADLFALARCEEVLGRLDAARALWEEIVIRDTNVARHGDGDRSGPWGRAAGTALAVHRWLEDTSGWTPAIDVDTIHWQRR